MKDNQEAGAGWLSSDSDAPSSSLQKEGSPPTPPPLAADEKPTDLKNQLEDAGSESDDSESELPLKETASKLMEDAPKVTKPRSKPNSKPSSSTKRSAVAEGEKSTKKSKTEEGKKPMLFQRLWSDGDEIAVLQGILDYKEKSGVDPMANANDFHDFIKESLEVDVDRRQMVDKIRRLRKRYETSSWKKKSLNSHETEVLELSKKIWGSDAGKADIDQQILSSVKTRTISKARNGSMVTIARKLEVESSGEGEKAGNREQFIGKASLSMGLDENIVKVGLELCRDDMKAEIEGKWRKLHLEESDLFQMKMDLARQESEMIIAAFKSACK